MSNITSRGYYEVILKRSGKRLQVEHGASLVQALKSVDIIVPIGCAQGICGICRTTVVDGVPEHHDSYLSNEEKAKNRTVLVCCADCLGDTLTLDL